MQSIAAQMVMRLSDKDHRRPLCCLQQLGGPAADKRIRSQVCRIRSQVCQHTALLEGATLPRHNMQGGGLYHR